MTELVAIVRHLARRALGEPLLLGFIALGVAISALDPHDVWWRAPIDYGVLLPIWTVAIRWWTRGDRPLELGVDVHPRARWRELAAIGIVVAIIGALAVWFWLHPRAPAAPGAPPVVDVRDPANHAAAGAVLASYARNAGSSVVIFGVPIAAMCALLQLGPRELGLAPRYLGLAAALVAAGIALAALFVLAGTPATIPLFATPALALPIFALHVVINGLPEEIVNRGVLMQRLLALTRSPITALVVSAALFDASHIPIYMWQRGDRSPWLVVASHISSNQPTGLVWAYLFYRTRSLWPGILWHTSFTVLGVLFA